MPAGCVTQSSSNVGADMKEKRVTLKDEVVEDAYKKCVREKGKDDVTCVGLYAQSKAGMISTDDYLSKMDHHLNRAQRPKKPRIGNDNSEE